MPLSVDDRLEILELMNRYNHCADGGDGDGFADTFTDDALFEGSMSSARGREELVQVIAGGGGLWKHWLNSPIIEGDGDRATAKVYLVRTGLNDDGAVELVASGTYHDTLARIEGEWKFTHRKVHPDQ
jgi:hypothetical protein